MMLFLGLIFFIHLFFTSAYIARFFVSSTIFNRPLRKLDNLAISSRNERTSLFPNALEYIFGYAFTSLLCLISLALFNSLYYGALLACIFSLIAVINNIKQQPLRFSFHINITSALLVKLAFTGIVAVIYGPMLLTLTKNYLLPSIFDLPKHISAVISAAHAQSWPTPNPYFPNFTFAYYIFFYLPLGVITRLLQSTSSGPPFLIAFSVVWITWQTLSLLEMLMMQWKIPKRFYVVGLLFATFINGYTAFITHTDAPVGFMTQFQLSSELWMDDPITSAIFLPPHTFSIICLLSCWLIFARTAYTFSSRLMIIILLSSSILSCYIIAPLSFVFLLAFLGYDWLSSFQKRKGLFIILLLFILITLPFFLESVFATRGDIGFTPIFPSWKTLGYLLLSGGPIIFFSFFAYFYLRKQNEIDSHSLNSNRKSISTSRFAYLTYALLIFVSLCSFFISNLDIQIKNSFFLRIMLVPLATAGFVWCWTKLKEKTYIGQWFFLGLPCLYSILLSILLTGYFISTAYLPRNLDNEYFLAKMRHLPFDAKILFLDTAQEQAALGGHLVYMNFNLVREGAYLPHHDQQQVIEFFDALSKNPKAKLHFNVAATVTTSTNLFQPNEPVS